MAVIFDGELQDENGNIFRPHSNSKTSTYSSEKTEATTTGEALDELYDKVEDATGIINLSQEEYDALPYEEKMNGKAYFVNTEEEETDESINIPNATELVAGLMTPEHVQTLNEHVEDTDIHVSTEDRAKWSQMETDITVERARIDVMQSLPEGSTSGDAALEDIKVGYDGTVWDTPGNAVRGQVSQLSNEIDYLNSGNYIKKINLEPDLIGWVHNNGTFMSDEEFYTSKPFEIQKGQTIKLVASGFRDNVSMISFYEGKNLNGTNVYTPLVISDGIPAKEYTYKAEMDMQIVVSYRIADTHSCEIVSNIKQLSSLLEQSNIIKNVDLESNYDVAYIHNTGEYFDSSHMTEYNTLHPFELKKGQTITLVGGGYKNNVSMITAYNGNNSYTPLVLSDCENYDVKEYTYTANENMMIVVSYNNSYYRKCYIITDIDKIVEGLDNSESTDDYLPMFHRIGGIGDSLMSGAICGESSTTCEDRYEYSWLSCICRKNGLTATHYSMGGLTTKTWFDWRKDQLIADAGKNSLFYIALGTNDVYQNYDLGSVSDESGTTTFCGKYKEIIELVHENNPYAPIFCVSTYAKHNNFGVCAELIKEICELYDYCYYVDLVNNLPSELIKTSNNSAMQQLGHYTGLGYIRVANIMEKLSNEIIRNNIDDFTFTAFYNS